MKLLICDLDGVINGSSDARADLVPGIKTKSTFWAKWHKAHVREDLNMDMLPLLRMYKEQGFEIAYLTNRQRECWGNHRRTTGGIPGRPVVYAPHAGRHPATRV